MFIADIGYLSFIENCIVLNVKQFYTVMVSIAIDRFTSVLWSHWNHQWFLSIDYLVKPTIFLPDMIFMLKPPCTNVWILFSLTLLSYDVDKKELIIKSCLFYTCTVLPLTWANSSVSPIVGGAFLKILRSLILILVQLGGMYMYACLFESAPKASDHLEAPSV